MKIILDEDTPAPLAPYLIGHDVTTVPMIGWAGGKNGGLLQLIEEGGFDAFLTCDRNLEHQQNLSVRPFAIVVFRVPNKKMQTLLPLVPQVLIRLQSVQPGQVYHIEAMAEGNG